MIVNFVALRMGGQGALTLAVGHSPFHPSPPPPLDEATGLSPGGWRQWRRSLSFSRGKVARGTRASGSASPDMSIRGVAAPRIGGDVEGFGGLVGCGRGWPSGQI